MGKSVPVLSMQTLTFQPGTSRGASGVGWYNDKAGLVGNAAAKPQRMHSSLLFSFFHFILSPSILFACIDFVYFSLSVIMNPATPPVIAPFEMLLHAFFLAKVGKPSLQAKNNNFYPRRGTHGLHLNELPCCFNTFPCRVFSFLIFPHLPCLLKQRCDSSISFSFFPTCQVRVVRFYVSCLLLLPRPAFRFRLPLPLPPSASCLVLLILLLNCDPRRTVFSVGPQPRPSTPSVPCRTSTTTIHAQCSLPDLNREYPRPVFPAGPQPRPSTPSVPCRTSTASIHSKRYAT